MSIRDIVEIIKQKLDITDNELLTEIITICEKLNIDINEKISINKDLKFLTDRNSSETEILQNIRKKIVNFNTTIKYQQLKKNLGKLQINIILNKIKSSKNSEDILNSLFELFNDKITQMNQIIEQSGGYKDDNYYYIYFKNKYIYK